VNKTSEASSGNVTLLRNEINTVSLSETLGCIKWGVLLFIFLLLFGLPIVPASGDNEDDCGEADGM
jgi:hypothetical protein